MNILLLEPDYKNKFPPIGLMKLAQFHRSRGDFVCFAKGVIDPKQAPTPLPKKWDKVYITSLFTFEWERTVATIAYAKTLVSPQNIHLGGVAATLMPDKYEAATGIRPHTGLLHCAKQLGFDDNTCIDTLVPDYSILEQVSHTYAFADAYLLTATRGCGQKCSFCAVQTLEPQYEHYIPILPRIAEIDRLYGQKRRLCLLDNNVLRSKAFSQIIADIKTAGFYKGATITNPKTGKQVRRSVDFNQGLDSLWLSEEKAKLLGEIALSPCHIAFDHIHEKERYVKALTLLERYDVTDVCSYLLFNTPDFQGKGASRPADTPRDLYERVRINAEFARDANIHRKKRAAKRFDGYSFPMRYSPLDQTDRLYIGPNWNKKLLAGLHEIKSPANGGIAATWNTYLSFMGSSYEEFYENLLLPQAYVKGRNPKGNPIWHYAISNWRLLYRALSAAEKQEFEDTIADNIFVAEKLEHITSAKVRLLYLHYFVSGTSFLKLLQYLSANPKYIPFLQSLIAHCPAIWGRTVLMLKGKNSPRIYANMLKCSCKIIH